MLVVARDRNYPQHLVFVILTHMTDCHVVVVGRDMGAPPEPVAASLLYTNDTTRDTSTVPLLHRAYVMLWRLSSGLASDALVDFS